MSQQKLPKSLTTVTTFSKMVALVLFIALPFIGFYVGQKYSGLNNYSSEQVSWKKYEDPNGYFSFEYPSNWRVEFSGKDQTYYKDDLALKDKKDISLSSTQGKVDIIWVDGYGGACEAPNYEDIKLKSETTKVCHATRDSHEYWEQISKKLDEKTSLGVDIHASADEPLVQNREVVLKILSSIDFSK